MEAERGRALRRRRPQVLHVAAAQVEAMDVPLLRFRVDDVRVAGIEDAVEAVPAPDRDPVGVDDSVLGPRPARADPVLVVLQPAADTVRGAEVHVDAIELAGRHPGEVLPAFARLVALVEAAVGAEQKPLGVARVDGERVGVGVDLLEEVLTERPASVVGDVQGEAEDVHAFVVRGIDADLAEVERARVERARARPGLSAVVGPEHPAAPAAHLVDAARARLVALHDRVHDLRVLGVDGEADAPRGGGQPAGRACARSRRRPCS